MGPEYSKKYFYINIYKPIKFIISLIKIEEQTVAFSNCIFFVLEGYQKSGINFSKKNKDSKKYFFVQLIICIVLMVDDFPQLLNTIKKKYPLEYAVCIDCLQRIK